MTTYAKHLVSKKKRRFIEDGFDLDLTFITRNIVAMGFPAEGREGIYRNNMRDVKRFFDTRHPEHYRIYNLCSERDYDPQKFNGAVEKFPFDDHNAPPFPLMAAFCHNVKTYLDTHEDNVAVIHCKAGKGRTGVMICALLVHIGMFEKTQDSLEFYGHARTMNGKGVTIPSQVRYVHYYGRYVTEALHYEPPMLMMKKVILKGVPDFSNGTCIPQFSIKQINYKSNWFEGISRDQREAVLTLEKSVPLCGDVKIEFIHKKSTGKEKMFHLWLNTFFVQDNRFRATQPEIDKANKDKKNKIFPAGFAVEIEFDRPLDGSKEGGKAVKVSGNASDGPDSATASSSRMPQGSQNSQVNEWSDSDLTTTDEDDDEWEGLPISDV